MDDARSEAIDVAGDAVFNSQIAYVGQLTGTDCERLAEIALDAIPATVLARLAIERGGLTRVGWQRPPEHAETIHRLRRTDDEAKRKGERPVYRLAEATDG